MKISEIQAPIVEEMVEFEKKFKEFMKSHVSLMNKIMTYIVKRKGKQIRPMLVFLSANIAGGVKEATFRGAALIELVHTASLVHDDVVDDSNYRRGFFSVNALWKNKIAVLVGDYLLARGMLLSVENNDFDLLKIFSTAVKEMSEGEILQMEKARNLDITEDIYFDIIRQKTATLIAACCAVGAASAGANAQTIEKFRDFGEKVGIAFQIKDDLFDYGNEEIGKPVGIDIKEKKMTLPLIFALNNANWSDRRRITNIVKNESEKPKKVAEVIDFVRKSGGIEYAVEAMKRYFEAANSILKTFEESAYRTSLEQLIRFTIERSK